MTGDYVPFDLTIAYSPEKTHLSINAKSDLGAASETAQLPFTQDQLNAQLDRFTESASGRLELQAGELKRFGGQLFNLVFQGSVKKLFEQTQMMVSEGVRVDLDIQNPGLSQIPWELMNNGTNFLALSQRSPIVRLAKSDEQGPFFRRPSPQSFGILFAAAKPWGEIPLNLGRQIRRICRVLRPFLAGEDVHLRCLLGRDLHPDRLRELIRSGNFRVFHLSTHGAFWKRIDGGVVALQDAQGREVPLAIPTLGDWIRDSGIDLVYLDACETATGPEGRPDRSLTSLLLSCGVSVILAMQFSVPDESATKFSEAFYAHLLKGEPVWRAATEARISVINLLSEERLDWAIPVLYLNHAFSSGVLVPRLSEGIAGRLASSTFVGRESDLDKLVEKVLDPSSRLVALHGFGGIGKSTVSTAILDEIGELFEGAVYVDCRGFKSILDSLSTKGSSLLGFLTPEELSKLSDRGKTERIVEKLDQRPTFLVLDNVDLMTRSKNTQHFLELLRGTTNVTVLVTTRILNKFLKPDRQQLLGELEEGDAILLLRNLAKNKEIQSILDASNEQLEQINDKLRGHPLAIELAIPYFRGKPFSLVLSELPRRVRGERRIVNILGWSFRQLTRTQRRILAKISIFHGQVPYGALLGILGKKKGGQIEILVEKNLLRYDQSTGLFSLHPLIREYAGKQLGDQRMRVGLASAKTVAPKLVLAGFWIEGLRQYEAGVEAASKFRMKRACAQLLHSLGDVFLRIGAYEQAKTAQDNSLQICKHARFRREMAGAFHSLGMIEESQCNYPEAVRLYDRSLEISRKLGNQSGIATTLHQLATIEEKKGNYHEAKKLYDQSLTIEQKLGNQSGMASTLGQLALIARHKGNYDEAQRLYNGVRVAFEKLGDQSGTAKALHQLANIQYLKGNFDQAWKLYNESLTIEQKIGDQDGIAKTLWGLALIEEVRGNYPEAVKLYKETGATFEKLGDQSGTAAMLHQLAGIEYLIGNHDEARKLYVQSLEIKKKLGEPLGIAGTLYNLAMIEQDRGNYDEALKLYNESLTIERKLRDQSGIAKTLHQLGRLAEQQRDLEAAERYHQQALEIFEKIGEKPNIEIARKNLERIKKLKQKP